MSTAEKYPPDVAAAPATETQKDQEFQKLMRRPVSLGERGVELGNMDDLFRFASCVINSKVGPKDMNVSGVMIAMQLGAELGLPPMASIQNIAVINGRPSIWGDAMLAICRRSGLFDEDAWYEEIVDGGDGIGDMAVCIARRLGAKLITQTFSMADAKKAGLLDRNTPWKTYPRRMLKFRARSWTLRDCFPDVLLGMRAAEEQMDCVDQAAEPAKTLDDLTKEMETPAKPTGTAEAAAACIAMDPASGVSKSVTTIVKAAEPVAETEPAVNPPTADEVKADQAQLADEFAGEFAKCEDETTLSNLTKAVVDAVKNFVLTEHQANGLYELANAAKERLSKV